MLAGMNAEASASGPTLSRMFARRLDPRWGTDPNLYSPDAMRRTMAAISKFYGPGEDRYFRVSSAGWENLGSGASVVVANHSGGTSFPDAWGLGWAWYDHFGYERPVHPMAHDMVWVVPPIAERFSKLGILRADRALAHEILTRVGHDIVVMPGGDRETWRPFNKRYELCWGQRTGYARTALKAGVPVSPIACAGGHSTFVVLSDGHRFARGIGLHRLARADIFPVHLSLPYLVGVGPFPHLPPPSHFRYLVGAPVSPVEHVPEGAEPSRLALREMDQRVRVAMQDLLDRLSAGELL